MKIFDSYAFDADVETVWNLLMDPQAIAKAIPGVDQLVPVEGEQLSWTTKVKIGIASVSGTYAGKIHMSEMQPPSQYRLTVKGEGQQSIIDGTALMKLSYDAEKQQTIVSWDADANLSGKLASIAQRLISAAATLLSKQFFRSLAAQLPPRDKP